MMQMGIKPANFCFFCFVMLRVQMDLKTMVKIYIFIYMNTFIIYIQRFNCEPMLSSVNRRVE